MIKIFLYMSLLFSLCFETSLCQIKQGAFELSTSGMMGSVSTTIEARSGLGPITPLTWSSTYITLAARVGYYVINEVVIEPEVFFNAVENWTPSYILSANLAYNRPFPDAHITPFVLAGYGVGNSVPSLIGGHPLIIAKVFNEFKIPVLQLGLGLKYHVGEHAAIRTEYRFQHYSYDQDFGVGASSTTTLNYNNILIGISVFVY